MENGTQRRRTAAPAELYTVKYRQFGGIITAQHTQAQIVENLQKAGVQLISVNDTGGNYYRPRKRR